MVEREEQPTPCPSCKRDMQPRQVERRDAGTLRIDLCFPCHAIWFDRGESTPLAPNAIVELFRDIHASRDSPRRSLAGHLACPRCDASLVLSYDLCKTGPFSYYRCPRDHGRLTPFVQFLREKQFVRSLTPAELSRVRAEIKELRCSSCGAPVDLERASSCAFCGAPIAVLDADAVEKAMHIWSEAESKRGKPNPQALAEALNTLGSMAGQAGQGAAGPSPSSSVLSRVSAGSDLLDVCIDVLGSVFSSTEDINP